MLSATECIRASEILACASRVLSIEFYVIKHDNSAAELNCRIFGLSPKSKAELEMLARHLNEAIQPVKNACAADLQVIAKGVLEGIVKKPTVVAESTHPDS